MNMHYTTELKMKLCTDICLNGASTIKSAQEYNIPLKTLEKWITAFNKDNHCFDPKFENVNDFKLINSSIDSSYDDLSNDELKKELMKKDIEIARLKKGYLVKEGDMENKVFVTFSKKNTKLSLCNEMSINRSDFYKWLSRRCNPSLRELNRIDACKLFEEYHKKFPSHGYRWLNAKIKLDLGIVYSDNFAHKICKYLGIKSVSKHVKRYGKKANRELKNFPNYILAELNPLRPFQLVVSDMTAFWANSHYYELTLFMDLFNNELITYSLSNKKGDPNSYHIGLSHLISKKEENYKDLEMIFHSDQGSVYSSKKFNESLPSYNIIHSMSKPGTPTENGAIEAINGWIKEELFLDFKINSCNNIFRQIEDYIYYFNYERPQAALNYLTPIQFKQLFYNKKD